jgi:Zn-dependent M28 family amino/carboxypeptidase
MYKFFFLSLVICNLSFGQKSIDSVTIRSLRKNLTIIASDDMQGRETGTKGIEKAAKYIENEFSKIGLTPIRPNKNYRQWYKISGIFKDAFNIIGCIEGKNKNDEYILISAHYDHLGIEEGQIYNGADDNGSGTAALLSIAEAIMKKKKEGFEINRNIVFIAFSGEEKGLLGSRYFTNNPIIPFEKISCNINIDMIGRVDPDRISADSLNYVHVVGQSKISSDITPILNELNSKTQNLVLDSKYDVKDEPNRLFYRSDHYNFAKNGVPVIFFFDGMLGGDYHDFTDDVDKINWGLYQKRVNFILDLTLKITNKKEMLRRDLKIR